MVEEIYKDCLNYDGIYQVSNIGNVRSIKSGKWILLTPTPDGWGYLQVTLTKNGVRKALKVHKLVYEAFFGIRPENMTIDHINNCINDNRLSNLQLLNNRDNVTKSKKLKLKSSQYTGVTWCKLNKKWASRIYINGRRNNLGYFTDEIEASNAYQQELLKLNQ